MIETRPRDTSPEAWEAYWAVIAGMSPEDRVRRVFELSEFGRELARGGIRARHPDYDDRQVGQALVRLLYGDSLYFQVYPGQDDQV